MMRWGWVLFFLVGGLLGAGQAEDAAKQEVVTPELKFLRLALASQHLREKGGPLQGFYLQLVNETKGDLQVAFATAEDGDPVFHLFENDYVPEQVQGWWKIGPGKMRRVFIERVLPRDYFLHARTQTVFWGKDRKFKVPCGDSEKEFLFNRYGAALKCEIDAEGCVVCTHRFKE